MTLSLNFVRTNLNRFTDVPTVHKSKYKGNMADALWNSLIKSSCPTFTIPLSQAELANRIDTSRESVSRVLSEFDKDGIIDVKGKQIEIVNKNHLN